LVLTRRWRLIGDDGFEKMREWLVDTYELYHTKFCNTFG
jgi:hypothetical protein